MILLNKSLLKASSTLHVALSRRKSLTLALGAVFSSAIKLAHAASWQALPSDGIELVFPRLADTGNAVPLQAKITAPPGMFVRSVRVILPENPNPLALQLTPMGAVSHYPFSTRLRLAASQSVWVVARFSDGSERANSAPTVITSTACLDDS